MVLGQKKRRRFCRWRSCRSCVLHAHCCGAKTALEARPVPGLELGPAGEELVLPAPADSSTPGVPQHAGSCHRKPSCPLPHGALGLGVGGKSQPPVQLLPGWERGTVGEQGLGLSQSVQMDISRAKGGNFWPQGTCMGRTSPPMSGGGAGTESGRGLLHSRATLAPQCYIRDRAEP